MHLGMYQVKEQATIIQTVGTIKENATDSRKK